MIEMLPGILLTIAAILIISFFCYLTYLHIVAMYRTRRLNDIYEQLEEIKQALQNKKE